MATLLIGFDSAWTRNHAGALAGVLHSEDGTFRDLGPPQVADFAQAEDIILSWQGEHAPTTTLVLLDQPTIVKNETGQRPVENLVCSSVSLRYGGMQPAYTNRAEMFGPSAPMWPFLKRFGDPADPLALELVAGTRVFETYPVLAMIALGWTLPDSRAARRLPKYNPGRRKTFCLSDWQHVCEKAAGPFRDRGLTAIADWLDAAVHNASPRKSHQDRVDACLCLLVALYLAERKEDCLMIGDLATGYIVVPHSDSLRTELEARCNKPNRKPADWVRTFRLPKAGSSRGTTTSSLGTT